MIQLIITSNAFRYVLLAAILVTTTLDLTAAYAQVMSTAAQSVEHRALAPRTNAAARSAVEARATLP